MRARHHDVAGVRAGQLREDVHVRPRLGLVVSMWAVDPGWASATPFAKLAPTTGMVTLSGADVPTIRPSLAGVFPWLKITTASAPAATAFSAFCAKLHVPRWISAMSEAPVKSSARRSRPPRSRSVLARGGTG